VADPWQATPRTADRSIRVAPSISAAALPLRFAQTYTLQQICHPPQFLACSADRTWVARCLSYHRYRDSSSDCEVIPNSPLPVPPGASMQEDSFHSCPGRTLPLRLDVRSFAGFRAIAPLGPGCPRFHPGRPGTVQERSSLTAGRPQKTMNGLVFVASFPRIGTSL